MKPSQRVEDYYSRTYPQSAYRKHITEDIESSRSLRTELPDLGALSPAIWADLKARIIALAETVTAHLVPENDDAKRRLKPVVTHLFNALKRDATAGSAEPDKVWGQIREPVLNRIRVALLQFYSGDMLTHFAPRIMGIVAHYSRQLPSYVAMNEVDDFRVVAQLEFLETVKIWDPEKSDDIWAIAFPRVVGALKDYIRHLTKSDPSRFFEWVSDAAYMHLIVNRISEIETKIENGIQLRDAMDGLSLREKKILNAYVKEDLTFQQIGHLFGLSESQVSRIYKKIVEKLRKKLVSQN
jgi:RNA polymerase sigma factor (sigma-70 family)